jgi:X-X-X-Leu-X-X-Gly heptad repeat protein
VNEDNVNWDELGQGLENMMTAMTGALDQLVTGAKQAANGVTELREWLVKEKGFSQQAAEQMVVDLWRGMWNSGAK